MSARRLFSFEATWVRAPSGVRERAGQRDTGRASDNGATIRREIAVQRSGSGQS
jgi:hypothetical protein